MNDPIVLNGKPTKPPRRKYTAEFKADLVAQCDRGDRSLALIAMEHQINANLVRKWQREHHGELSPNKLVPVKVDRVTAPLSPTGYIEITSGSVSLKVIGQVDGAYIASIVRALR